MANNLGLDLLRVRQQELGEEQQLASAFVTQCQEDIEQRRAAVQTTQEQAEGAADEDDRTQAKYLALLEYLNDFAEAPLVLLDQITTLQAEMVKTGGARRHTADLSQKQHRGLREAESRLAFAEQSFMLIQKSLQGITEDRQSMQ